MVDTGIAIPYTQIEFEMNMKIVNLFGCTTDKQHQNSKTLLVFLPNLTWFNNGISNHQHLFLNIMSSE